jgi:hypothetical protein
VVVGAAGGGDLNGLNGLERVSIILGVGYASMYSQREPPRRTLCGVVWWWWWGLRRAELKSWLRGGVERQNGESRELSRGGVYIDVLGGRGGRLPRRRLCRTRCRTRCARAQERVSSSLWAWSWTYPTTLTPWLHDGGAVGVGVHWAPSTHTNTLKGECKVSGWMSTVSVSVRTAHSHTHPHTPSDTTKGVRHDRAPWVRARVGE